MRRVIIAGSRGFDDKNLLSQTLDMLFVGPARPKEEMTILCGMAKGADLLGKEWAEHYKLPVEEYPADWDKYGKSAGVIRNTTMAIVADTLVAFWDGKSRGTKHMIECALEKGLEVHVYRFADTPAA